MTTFQDAATVHLPEVIPTVEEHLGVPLGPIRVISVREDVKYLIAMGRQACYAEGKKRPGRTARAFETQCTRFFFYLYCRQNNRFGNIAASTVTGPTRALMITDEIGDCTREFSVGNLEGNVYHETYHVGIVRYAMSKGMRHRQANKIPRHLNEGFAEIATSKTMREKGKVYNTMCNDTYCTWAKQLATQARNENCETVRDIADLVLRLSKDRTANY